MKLFSFFSPSSIKYRIITDRWAGYEAQYKVGWWPFWIQIAESPYKSNTSGTIERAKHVCKTHYKAWCARSKNKPGVVVSQFTGSDIEDRNAGIEI
jgi:hypothetical protein